MRTIDKVLSELVNSFYRQKPLPKTAVVFKMKMIAAIEYCKEFNLPIPDYDAHIEARESQNDMVAQDAIETDTD